MAFFPSDTSGLVIYRAQRLAVNKPLVGLMKGSDVQSLLLNLTPNSFALNYYETEIVHLI